MSRPVQHPHVSHKEQFAYQPALDGVRGVAVAMVLCFHGGFSWMTGGYVGVSVFFTLSGFLITSLLILEHQRSGRVAWGAFVTRRAKRLLPASMACLAAVAILAKAGRFEGVPHLRRDLFAAALQVSNWNSLHNSGSYAELLTRSAGLISPVEHFWSLAVEEQFYWVWPLVFVLVRRVSNGSGRLFASLASLAVVGMVVARWIALRWGGDAAYWATPARLGEILVGAALAAGCVHWQRRPRWLGFVGVCGAAVVVWSAVQWPAGGGAAYAGWFGVFSVASAAVILGVQAPGPLRAALSAAPLAWLGRLSYGVYVYHWPVFVLVDRRALDVQDWVLFAVRMVITLCVAGASYWLLELPVRRLELAPRRAFVVAMPIVAAVMALVGVLVPSTAARRHVATDGPVSTVAAVSTTPIVTAGSPSSPVTSSVPVSATSAVAADTPIDVLLLGDSTAMMLAGGLNTWVADEPQRQARSLAESGCGVLRSTRMQGDDSGDFVRKCSRVLSEDLPEALATRVPDVVVVMVTVPDVSLREWVGSEGMLPPSDARYHEHALDDHRALTLELMDAGVQHIVWVLPPVPADWWIGWLADEYQPSDWDAQAAIIGEVAGEFPRVTQVVDLDAWLTDSGMALDVSMRDDGLHLSPEGSARVMTEFLGPVLLRLSSV